MTTRGNWILMLATLAAAAWGFAGCAAHAQPVQVEQVGTLTAGASVYSAPMKHDAPPELGFVAGSDDDSVGEVVSTVTRAADAEAPAVVAKDQGLTLGTVR